MSNNETNFQQNQKHSLRSFRPLEHEVVCLLLVLVSVAAIIVQYRQVNELCLSADLINIMAFTWVERPS